MSYEVFHLEEGPIESMIFLFSIGMIAWIAFEDMYYSRRRS